MILQLAFVLTAIIIGARLGGIGLTWRNGRRRVGNTHVRFWFTTYCASHRRYVNDCRRNLCRFLYAGSRRFGLYGETGRTFAS